MTQEQDSDQTDWDRIEDIVIDAQENHLTLRQRLAVADHVGIGAKNAPTPTMLLQPTYDFHHNLVTLLAYLSPHEVEEPPVPDPLDEPDVSAAIDACGKLNEDMSNLSFDVGARDNEACALQIDLLTTDRIPSLYEAIAQPITETGEEGQTEDESGQAVEEEPPEIDVGDAEDLEPADVEFIPARDDDPDVDDAPAEQVGPVDMPDLSEDIQPVLEEMIDESLVVRTDDGLILTQAGFDRARNLLDLNKEAGQLFYYLAWSTILQRYHDHKHPARFARECLRLEGMLDDEHPTRPMTLDGYLSTLVNEQDPENRSEGTGAVDAPTPDPN